MAEVEIIVLEELQIATTNEGDDRITHLNDEPNLCNRSTPTESTSNSNSTAPQEENWGWSGESPMIKRVHYFLTKETFSMVVNIFRFCSFMKCVPFELEFKNGESLRVRPFQKKWQWVLWHFVSWIIFGMLAFQFISFFFLWQRMDFGQEMAFHILYLVLTPWLFVYFLTLYQNPRACIVMLNHHDEIMRNSSKLGLSRKHWASFPFVILSVYYVAWIFVLFDFVLVVFYLRHPERSQYIYSVFPSFGQEAEKILYWICALYELFWFGCGSSLICLFLCYWCACIYTFNGSLNALLSREKLNENTIESYLFLQLFCVSFNDFNGGFFAMGFCFVLGASPVLFIYISLTAFNLLSIFVYLAFPAFAAIAIALIVLFLPQHSKVQIKSRDVLHHLIHLPIGGLPQYQSCSSNLMNLSHLTYAERRGYLKRRVKAFRRLRIQISFFGAFSLQTPAVMMDKIFSNFVLLLSL